MPPKSAQKPKKAVTPEPKATPKKGTPAQAVPKSTPKKAPKPPPVFKRVTVGDGPAVPVDVCVEGPSLESKLGKTGGYGHTLRLEAPASFTLLRTLTLTEGSYVGYQAIIIRPAKAFPFLKLGEEIRSRIYGFYFAPKGVVGDSIALDGKRLNKDIFAKTYAEGSKNRVGLLVVNQEIKGEAITAFYAHTLKLESTTTLLDFLSQIPNSVYPLLRSLDVKAFVKTTSRNAMHFLSDARNLQRLRIEAGVFAEGDTAKAARFFYGEAYKFLEAMGHAKGDKVAGVEMLEFGKEAFTFKNENKEAKPWAASQVEKFKGDLRAKLQAASA